MKDGRSRERGPHSGSSHRSRGGRPSWQVVRLRSVRRGDCWEQPAGRASGQTSVAPSVSSNVRHRPMSPSPEPSPNPSPTRGRPRLRSPQQPESSRRSEHRQPSPPTRKASPLPARKELGEGVGETLERVAHQDSVMIRLATHPAMPTRIDTDTSWAHTAKETAAPFQQSVSSPPKPMKFPSPTRPEPFTHKGFLEMSVWLVKSRLQAVQLRCRSAVGGLLTGQMTSC